jgi:predicted lipid-binding transport protein (Tim44 family)
MRPNPPKSTAPAAGGCLLALGLIGGAVAGVLYGQTTLGVLIGGASGAIAATIIFLIDRRR